jgi:hypothetical protein
MENRILRGNWIEFKIPRRNGGLLVLNITAKYTHIYYILKISASDIPEKRG